jgi:hypothetical protein
MKYHIAAQPHKVASSAYLPVTLRLAGERRDEGRQQLARGLNPRLEKKPARESLSVSFPDVASPPGDGRLLVGGRDRVRSSARHSRSP